MFSENILPITKLCMTNPIYFRKHICLFREYVFMSYQNFLVLNSSLLLSCVRPLVLPLYATPSSVNIYMGGQFFLRLRRSAEKQIPTALEASRCAMGWGMPRGLVFLAAMACFRARILRYTKNYGKATNNTCKVYCAAGAMTLPEDLLSELEALETTFTKIIDPQLWMGTMANLQHHVRQPVQVEHEEEARQEILCRPLPTSQTTSTTPHDHYALFFEDYPSKTLALPWRLNLYQPDLGIWTLGGRSRRHNWEYIAHSLEIVCNAFPGLFAIVVCDGFDGYSDELDEANIFFDGTQASWQAIDWNTWPWKD